MSFTKSSYTTMSRSKEKCMTRLQPMDSNLHNTKYIEQTSNKIVTLTWEIQQPGLPNRKIPLSTTQIYEICPMD